MKGIILTLIFLSFALGHFQIFAGDCPIGQKWDKALNRCMLTEKAIEEQDQHKECSGMAEGSAKDACIKKAADARQRETIDSLEAGRVKDGDVADNGQWGGGFSGFTSSFAEAYSLISGISLLAAKGMDKDTFGSESCLSCTIAAGTGVYNFYQSKIQKEDVEKKTKEFKEEYEAYTKDPESMKGAQLEAFNMLEKEQDYLAGVSGKHAKQYRTTALGYTAAAVAAAYDIYKEGGTKCFGGEGSTFDWGSPAGWLKNPCLILIGGAVAAGASMTISNTAKQQQEDAEMNVKQIQELKKKYIHSVANLCPDGRTDMSKPACYCYTDAGEENPNRKKSKTCQDFWNQFNGSYVASSDASRAQKQNNPEGCIFVDGKFDRECNCRKLKNSKGKNACLKTVSSPTALSTLKGLGLTEALTLVDETAQGNAGNYTSSNANQGAITAKALDAIKKKMDKPFQKATGLTLDKAANKFADSMGRYGDKNNVAIFNGSNEQLARLRPMLSPQVQQAVASVESKLPKQGVVVRKKSSRTRSKTNNANKWSFDDSSSSEVLSFGNGADSKQEEKRYDLGDNDIIKDKSVSIFKVISHRYVQSGLKKLFSE